MNWRVTRTFNFVFPITVVMEGKFIGSQPRRSAVMRPCFGCIHSAVIREFNRHFIPKVNSVLVLLRLITDEYITVIELSLLQHISCMCNFPKQCH